MRKLVLYAYGVLIVLLFLYSFTQIDLGLTLTRVSVWQVAQRAFQYIGYFNRPLSTYLFLILFSLLTLSYLVILKLIHENKLKKRAVWGLVIFTAVLLLFSYNAFSYDLFNYMFDARITTHYHQNPYLHRALDYPGDPMLSFMHWTHRAYPYGPVWLALTIPLSFMGGSYFLITFYLFKALIVASFLGISHLVYKIATRTKIADPLFALAFFALNPLVIAESLVSAHLDSVMMFFALLSFYLLIEKKYVWSVLFLVASIGIKFATVFLLPVYLLYLLQKKLTPTAIYLASAFMIATVILASYRTTFQPWYLLEVLAFTPFLSKKYFMFIPTVIISCFSLLQYVPYLYLGNWNSPVPAILNDLLFVSLGLSVVLTGAYSVFRRK